MRNRIDYYLSPMSPWTYFGHERLGAIAARYDAEIAVKPVDFGRIFAATGGLPVRQRPPARQAYRMLELARWREYLGLPLNLEPKFFPVNTERASLWIIAAGAQHGSAQAMALTGAFLAGCWSRELDLAQEQTLSGLSRECGLDPASLAAGEAKARADYDAYTDEALGRGVFGAPTYWVGEEFFWGQDRLDFLERALAR